MVRDETWGAPKAGWPSFDKDGKIIKETKKKKVKK